MGDFVKGFVMAMPIFLAACAGPATTTQNAGVEDIAPGEESVIQSPPPANASQSSLEERSI